MSEVEKRTGRARNAERTRKVILDAAEGVFAQSGFAGARFDAIALASGYNKSLIGQYFGDKLGLYTELLKRTDSNLQTLHARVLAPWLESNGSALSEPELRSFLGTIVQTTFTYLVEHPNFLRILTWEMADGWRTYAKIFPGSQQEDAASFTRLVHHAVRAGLLRPGFTPLIRLAMITQICHSYLAYLPLYQMMLGKEDVSTEQALSLTCQHLVRFVAGGMMNDAANAQS
jgi:TetR/AcrR family transcriptional regulator